MQAGGSQTQVVEGKRAARWPQLLQCLICSYSSITRFHLSNAELGINAQKHQESIHTIINSKLKNHIRTYFQDLVLAKNSMFLQAKQNIINLKREHHKFIFRQYKYSDPQSTCKNCLTLQYYGTFYTIALRIVKDTSQLGLQNFYSWPFSMMHGMCKTSFRTKS